MYESFFGLTEPPFSITPDPRYLYPSSRHIEAIGHLFMASVLRVVSFSSPVRSVLERPRSYALCSRANPPMSISH